MLHKYVDLVKNTTEYANRMRRLNRRIFGEVIRPTTKKSMRITEMMSAFPIDKTDYYVNYYPRHVEMGILMKKLRFYGLFRDEHLDFKDEMDRLRRLRGKETEFKRKLREQKQKYLLEDLENLKKAKF